VIISEEFGLPVILHCVKAYNDIISVRKELRPDQPWILHAYNGNLQVTQQMLKYDFYFSFGKSLMNPADKLLASINIIPRERIFPETDEENLTIQSVYSRLNKILAMDMNNLKEIIKQNFVNCFGAKRELS
jgi:TatD DNase family protein